MTSSRDGYQTHHRCSLLWYAGSAGILLLVFVTGQQSLIYSWHVRRGPEGYVVLACRQPLEVSSSTHPWSYQIYWALGQDGPRWDSLKHMTNNLGHLLKAYYVWASLLKALHPPTYFLLKHNTKRHFISFVLWWEKLNSLPCLTKHIANREQTMGFGTSSPHPICVCVCEFMSVHVGMLTQPCTCASQRSTLGVSPSLLPCLRQGPFFVICTRLTIKVFLDSHLAIRPLWL